MAEKKILVMKFGGAAVATPEAFGTIVERIEERLPHHNPVVVVSAMGNMTDRLIQLALRVNPQPPEREMDMLISVGERISVSLLAMALAARGHQAVSFTGSQSGILTCDDHTNARITGVRPTRLLPHLDAGRIVIVAGFQGVSSKKEITTLGRGGSDTTAVALAAALAADHVAFFKDVDGIYEMDPNLFPDARLLPHLSYPEATAIAERAAHSVLHPRAIALAERNALPLHLSSFRQPDTPGTWIRGADDSRPAPIFELALSTTET